jgi:hypothetical protein
MPGIHLTLCISTWGKSVERVEAKLSGAGAGFYVASMTNCSCYCCFQQKSVPAIATDQQAASRNEQPTPDECRQS